VTDEERARAAKSLLSNPVTRVLLDTMRQGYLDGIAASALPDVALRENNYAATRAITEMLGQLEVWARAAK
jgi:hypothetical protein